MEGNGVEKKCHPSTYRASGIIKKKPNLSFIHKKSAAAL